MEFKFYDNFFDAINLLPEGEREKACYEFCKYGITGKLPEDKNLAMFCLGVSVSVQKYQGRGGNHNPKGNNQYSLGQRGQRGQRGLNGQNGLNEQTETITETKTKTKTKTKEKENKKRKESFTPPTPEEVQEYCKEKGYTLNAFSFCDYYTSNGWRVGKNKMRNWRAAVNNWNRNEVKYARGDTTPTPYEYNPRC